MTKSQFVLTLTTAVGEAFARHVAAQAKAPEGKKFTYVRPVKMKDYFSYDDAPACLDYIPEEDFISVRYDNDKYIITFYGSDDSSFTVRNSDYWSCVLDFIETFLAIYRA